MYKIKEFFITNFSEILSIISLFIIFFLLMIIFGQHMGNALIDCGREAYFPAELLRGKVLYKDIFNIFGPLSYQINAVFYLIFGVNLKSLYLVGFLNANLIIFLLYFLARFFTSKEISWVVTLFIMISCVFSPGVFNYIFPYSYAMVYAFSSLLFSVLFLLLYLKTSKDFFMPLAWFFAGISLASKYDYFIYVIFLFILMFLKRPKDKKYFFISLISFFTVPVLSFSILFLQGLNLEEFLNQLHLIKNFSLSPSLNIFYKKITGIYPNSMLLLIGFKIFCRVAALFIGLLGSVYFMFWNKYNFIIRVPLSFLFAIFFCYKLFLTVALSPFAFCWLPIFTMILFVFFVINFSKDFKSEQFLAGKNGIYLIFIFIGLLASIKSFFYLNHQRYGAFALPMLLIINSVFITEYLPDFFKFIDKKALKNAFFAIVLGLSVLSFGVLFIASKNDIPIKSKRGIIYTPEIFAPMRDSIDYIEKNLKPNNNVWVIPEGIMINFLTNRHSFDVYYALNPPYIETFGEDKILKDIEKNPPDYIIINNRTSVEYGYGCICEDYGLEICKYIKSSYSPVTTFGNKFKMILYKKSGLK